MLHLIQRHRVLTAPAPVDMLQRLTHCVADPLDAMYDRLSESLQEREAYIDRSGFPR